jgi:hypothetical protein
MEVCCTQVTRRHSHETNGKRVQLQHAETLARPALRTGRSSLARHGALKRCHHVFSASWPGFISPNTLGTPSSSPLRSLTLFNGFRAVWTPGMNRVCTTPSLHLFMRGHQNSLVVDRTVTNVQIRHCPSLQPGPLYSALAATRYVRTTHAVIFDPFVSA